MDLWTNLNKVQNMPTWTYIYISQSLVQIFWHFWMYDTISFFFGLWSFSPPLHFASVVVLSFLYLWMFHAILSTFFRFWPKLFWCYKCVDIHVFPCPSVHIDGHLIRPKGPLHSQFKISLKCKGGTSACWCVCVCHQNSHNFIPNCSGFFCFFFRHSPGLTMCVVPEVWNQILHLH